jgi:hypothetical protein
MVFLRRGASDRLSFFYAREFPADTGACSREPVWSRRFEVAWVPGKGAHWRGLPVHSSMRLRFSVPKRPQVYLSWAQVYIIWAHFEAPDSACCILLSFCGRDCAVRGGNHPPIVCDRSVLPSPSGARLCRRLPHQCGRPGRLSSIELLGARWRQRVMSEACRKMVSRWRWDGRTEVR